MTASTASSATVNTRSPLVDLRLTETDREAVIHVDLNAELPEDVERFVIESLVFSFATMANFLFDGDIPPATVEMSMAEPAHAELYAVFYRAPLTIRFDADGNRLHFRRDVLDRPLPLANQQTRNLVEKQVSQEMERLTGHPAKGVAIIPQVKALITEMPGHYPAMEEVAERLAMTTRTLHRRIEKAGTSFKSLVDNARLAEATRYLEDTGLSVTQISYLLGYNDSSNFSRAFRRWSGKAPLQYREAAHS